MPAALALTLLGTPALAEEVGSFSNDWTGNGVVIEAFPDPEVEGVTCHVAHFSRSLIDRVTKGNWFEDPSNASIACRQTGPLVIGDIETDEEGEEIFSEGKSLVFKSLAVRRIWDDANKTLVYVVYTKQVTDGSAKIAISTVSTFNQEVRRKP
ncbi:CreA family protein [Geminicoccus roseus]|uniref:CreA family protein n=1 Tax=Geminicoccus roseus TaxID=404900 RepID=UPI00041B3D0B|nr:CreA family protein [Geminicoccus roseus]